MADHAPRRPVDGQVRLLTKVAHLYHERGLRQADIAVTLNLSQAKVSRLLKRAAEVGIVRTTVLMQPGLHTDLEDQLQQRFGMLDVVVVEVASDEEVDVYSAIGAAAASYLEASVSGQERIGISSWSQTLLAMVDRMRPLSARGATEVVQLLGGIGVPDVQHQAQRLTGDLARNLGAEPVYVPAPGIVVDPTVRDGLLLDASLSEVTRRWQRLTMAVVGIGSIEPSNLLEVSGNAFSADDRQRLLRAGAVGDICHHVFDGQGGDVTGDLAERRIAIPAADFRAIPRRIGIAGGMRKRWPVRGALAGGWINVLITDLETAQWLLQDAEAGIRPGRRPAPASA